MERADTGARERVILRCPRQFGASGRDAAAPTQVQSDDRVGLVEEVDGAEVSFRQRLEGERDGTGASSPTRLRADVARGDPSACAMAMTVV